MPAVTSAATSVAPTGLPSQGPALATECEAAKSTGTRRASRTTSVTMRADNDSPASLATARLRSRALIAIPYRILKNPVPHAETWAEQPDRTMLRAQPFKAGGRSHPLNGLDRITLGVPPGLTPPFEPST